MKLTLTTSAAVELLKVDQFARWSRNGAAALVEYLENVEDECGTEIEFDHVALRCDFTEYKSALEAATQCGFEPSAFQAEDDDAAFEWLQDRTQVIEFESGVIIRNF
jgi:hypothetical protein